MNDKWDLSNFVFGIIIGGIVMTILTCLFIMGNQLVENGTLNQVCADYNGQQYMFNYMRGVDNAPDMIICKLRPDYGNETMPIARISEI